MSLQNHQGVRMIKICLSQTPNEETMAALETFLEHAHIRTLELDWPQLDPHILEAFSLIPHSLEYLLVRARSAADAFDIIWSIAESRYAGDLPNLIELVLLRSNQTYDDITPATNDRKDSGTGQLADYADTVSLLVVHAPEAMLTHLYRCTLLLTTQMPSTSSGHKRACKRWVCESFGAQRDCDVWAPIKMRSERCTATACHS